MLFDRRGEASLLSWAERDDCMCNSAGIFGVGRCRISDLVAYISLEYKARALAMSGCKIGV